MKFFAFVFYLFGILALMFELMTVWNPIKVSKFYERLKEAHKKEGDFKTKYSDTQRTYLRLDIGYITWTIVGLMSSQWVLFMALFLLGMLTAGLKKLSPAFRWINAVISAALIAFIMINAYQLHIDVWEIIKSWWITSKPIIEYIPDSPFG